MVHEHRKTFDPLGPMKLTLDEAHEIVHAEPLFRFKPKSWFSSIFDKVELRRTQNIVNRRPKKQTDIPGPRLSPTFSTGGLEKRICGK